MATKKSKDQKCAKEILTHKFFKETSWNPHSDRGFPESDFSAFDPFVLVLRDALQGIVKGEHKNISAALYVGGIWLAGMTQELRGSNQLSYILTEIYNKDLVEKPVSFGSALTPKALG